MADDSMSRAAAKRSAIGHRVITPAVIVGALLLAELVALSRQAQPVTAVSDTAVIESYTVYASRGAQLVGPYSRTDGIILVPSTSMCWHPSMP